MLFVPICWLKVPMSPASVLRALLHASTAERGAGTHAIVQRRTAFIALITSSETFVFISAGLGRKKQVTARIDKRKRNERTAIYLITPRGMQSAKHTEIVVGFAERNFTASSAKAAVEGSTFPRTWERNSRNRARDKERRTLERDCRFGTFFLGKGSAYRWRILSE